MIHAGTVKLGREGAMSDVAVMILAGGQGERLSILSRQRAKPAVPFGGKYRIIDFALSNCVNSGLYDVAVLTQYRPHSLNEHIGHGRPWDLDRERNGGVVILQPYLGRSTSGWYRGTADAVYHNLFYITRRPYRDVLILAGDHVYAMDYRPMIAQHRERCADVTIAVQPVDWREASRFGVVIVAEDGWVVDFEEKPERPRSNLASMGIYLFRRDLLLDLFTRDHPDAPEFIDFGRDVIPYLIRTARVATYRFDGYWQDVGTVQSYWEANMALLEDEPKLNLYDPNWRIHTRSEERPPAKILEGATVIRSLLSNGCIVEGATVIRSILSPGVIVKARSGGARFDRDDRFGDRARSGRRSLHHRQARDDRCQRVPGLGGRQLPELVGAQSAEYRNHPSGAQCGRAARGTDRTQRVDRARGQGKRLPRCGRAQRGNGEPDRDRGMVVSGNEAGA
jgi:glucose-1-phosphate adenylyltransferase